MYDLDCMRCKKKIPEDFAKFSNYCEDCFDLVFEKSREIMKKVDELKNELDDFKNGKDLGG